MKILTVSAHYPPNFVSGGTLAPQRVARGLRSLGHEVEVFAGWLGDRPPLETWTEVDETGLPVHWIVTTPWTAWNDDHNFENPEVADRFRMVLERVRPDLVHVHSLQTLGGGVVRAATNAGIATVVTMHDFWWCCGRQFLVTRDFTPCCPVVDAGECPCEVDNDWLRRRNDRLRSDLAGVDLVLAVSGASHRLLAANGIAAGVLEVDENGLPSGEPTTAAARRPLPCERSDDEPLRLLFAGGADRMKGGHVLLAALQELGRPGRWRLAAHGLRPLAVELGIDDESLPITWADPFSPDEADDVFAAVDVVVVPSVMRESHSILTREALLHGRVPVVTDTFGPEEVVADGENGLVVPAGDAGALAAALRRLVDDRQEVVRMAHAPVVAAIRELDDQVRHLDRRFRKLVAERRTRPPLEPASLAVPSAHGRRVARVAFLVGIEGAPLRYRARLPAEALRLVGVEATVHHYRDPAAWSAAFEADAVVVYRVPATDQVLQLLDGLRRAGTPAFFDVDDLIFDPDLRAEIPALQILPPDEAALWLQGVERYRTTMEGCDAFIGSTRALCDHAEQVVGLPAFRFANGVGLELARRSDRALRRPRSPGPFRFGYLSGTDTHDHDWRFIEGAVVRFLERHREAELWIGGILRVSSALDPFVDRVRRLPWTAWDQLPEVLRDLDVNLAPLEPGSRFNDAKSAIKWLEAALVATPTIASPTQPFREAIVDGRNGILAGEPDEWLEALEAVAADPARRRGMGARARRDVLLEWSPHLQGRRYAEILSSTIPERSHPGTFRPVALDEPWAPGGIPLDPYPPAPRPDEPPPSDLTDPPPPPPAARRAQDLVRRGRQSVREVGATQTIRRSVGWLQRRSGRLMADLRRG